MVTGAMTNEWHNVFGLKGVDFGNAFIEVGFSPMSPTGLVKLGVGATTELGETTLQFDGIIDIDDPKNLCLIAKAEHLSLRDLCSAWDHANPNFPQINLNHVPDLLDFKDLEFSFAPKSASIDVGDGHVVDFIAGLAFQADLKLFGVHLALKNQLLLDASPVDFVMYAHYDDGKEDLHTAVGT